MFTRSLLLFSLPAVLSIIVTDPPPSETDYKYAYEIEDPSTGDTKSQHEVRRGDVVTGSYSVLGPDGTKRIVEYTADSKHGFNAVLREEPAMKLQPKESTQRFRQPIIVQEAPNSLQKPLAYVVQKLPSPHAEEIRNIYLFTPENEIKLDRLEFEYGKYFEPATK